MLKFLIALLMILTTQGIYGDNQTTDISPVLDASLLPFKVSVVQADFQLPSDDQNSYGLQSYVFGLYNGKWLLITGRNNGLHGFTFDNFPSTLQNRTVFVVDPNQKTVVTRSLTDASSGLTWAQIDTLSVTAAQSYQVDNTLYIIGGYGVDTPTEDFSTKSTLTAIDIPGLMNWVETGKKTAAQFIRQISHPLLQVTGGYLTQANPHDPFLLIFGQNFVGKYTSSSSGIYTEQVRPFKIIDNGNKLYIQPGKQFPQDPNYRRRDLNVVPIVQKTPRSYASSFVALSGVFTETTGAWTVPVSINADGTSFMPDPSNSNTFKQGMNNYNSAHVQLFSKKTNDMYIMLFGGLSYIIYPDETPDVELPFVNTVTTVQIDSVGNFYQYVMGNLYPTIFATWANPGNVCLFGAASWFIPADNLPMISQGVFSLDSLGSEPVLLGYIVGGIQSTLPNTNTRADSSSSPYIFSVILQRQ